MTAALITLGIVTTCGLLSAVWVHVVGEVVER